MDWDTVSKFNTTIHTVPKHLLKAMVFQKTIV